MFHVVEDDAAVADALVLMLREFDHEVRSYPDAEEFLREARLAGSDTVIVDLALPGMGGGELVRFLETIADPPRVVVISGEPQGELDRHLEGLPKLPVIRKPVDVEDLRRLF
ncbi:response regulator receiver domain-containing protein [Tepidamorphus gemmatus]|uniref:Response regulator receiver domain-containing protein n=1 Tax=Tepidamorphus gemmatus TaxID=747076 RepID=A0A4R3M8B4_9HYPH|nr:response regulator [Tepidamorphus gemmatus]TCT09336.1 response regulator receiver domain-containing protein [Tepidamorphus gemmatus]